MIGKFIGLKSKNYAFTYENELLNEKEKEKLIRCKGTTKATIKNEIHFDSLVNTLKECKITKMIIILFNQRIIKKVYVK